MATTTLKRSARSGPILSAIGILAAFAAASCGNNAKTDSPMATPNTAAAPAPATPAAPPANFESRTDHVNGTDIHYVIGGHGEPLVLLHGFGENWYVWNRLLPELSKHFTVIAPDLRGIGESGHPDGGYDKKTMAVDIHELVKKLGYTNIDLVGHHIGLMVAYAYAVQYAGEVKRLALLDAPLPGVEPVWHQVATTEWHFGFFSRPIAADMLAGHEREFLTDFWPLHAGPNKDSFHKEEVDEFIRAFSTPGSIQGSLAWYKAFPQDAKDNTELIKQKLKIPVLAMGGEFSAAPILGDDIRQVADNVTETVITGAGHWIMQEQPEQVQKGLLDFFVGK